MAPLGSLMWASVSAPWAVGGGKGELAGVLLLEGAEAGPRGRTCCLGRSSAAWLASPASPPGGPQEAQRRPAAIPWPASPLGDRQTGEWGHTHSHAPTWQVEPSGVGGTGWEARSEASGVSTCSHLPPQAAPLGLPASSSVET